LVFCDDALSLPIMYEYVPHRDETGMDSICVMAGSAFTTCRDISYAKRLRDCGGGSRLLAHFCFGQETRRTIWSAQSKDIISIVGCLSNPRSTRRLRLSVRFRGWHFIPGGAQVMGDVVVVNKPASRYEPTHYLERSHHEDDNTSSHLKLDYLAGFVGKCRLCVI